MPLCFPLSAADGRPSPRAAERENMIECTEEMLYRSDRRHGLHHGGEQLDEWLRAAGIGRGRIFRRITRMGRTWGDCMTEKSIWHIVKDCAKGIGMPKLAPHDLRRTCARLCHASGSELEQIQFLLGHVSVQTTERYLGCKQRIRSAVNDRIGIEPNP